MDVFYPSRFPKLNRSESTLPPSMSGMGRMENKLKSGEQSVHAATAMQHAALSIILLGIIMGSLIQITHMLIENRETLAIVSLTLPH
jgi:hypothetical protein